MKKIFICRFYIIPNGYSKEDISEEVMSALTKNYSALMKKIDEKKGRL